MYSPPSLDTRWHCVLFQKLACAKWTNELTAQVAVEFASLTDIGPRLVLIVAVYVADQAGVAGGKLGCCPADAVDVYVH